MLCVYVLQCENNKYYIGKTTNHFRETYREHLNGTASDWTKLYKPIRLVDLVCPAELSDEQRLTTIFMNRFGVDNVRSDLYPEVQIEDRTMQFINNELLGSIRGCLICEKEDHLTYDCEWYVMNEANVSDWGVDIETKSNKKKHIGSYLIRYIKKKLQVTNKPCFS